jgi:hypothetical protein
MLETERVVACACVGESVCFFACVFVCLCVCVSDIVFETVTKREGGRETVLESWKETE